MKFSLMAVVALGVAVVSAATQAQDSKDKAAAPAPLKDLKSKASYVIGLNIGRNIKSQAIDVDPEIVAQAIKDAMTGAKPLMTDEEAQDVLNAFRAKQMESAKGAAEKNKKEGDAFLAANKAKPGVQTLPSGLQYKVLKEGTGKVPTANDTVLANYRGTFLNGTEFDSSYKRGKPSEFPVNGVIKGWTEALLKMKTGSKWQLFIPSDLAYGPQGRPGIEPNSVLLFDIELVDIVK